MGNGINARPMDAQNLLDKYSSKKNYPPLGNAEGETSTEKTEYSGLVEYGRGGRNPRFRIVDNLGNSYGSSYAHLLGWLFTPPDILTLQTTTHIFTIEGKGLGTLERVLMDEKAKEIHAYNPAMHSLPEETKVFIEKIEIINRFEGAV